MSRKEKAGERNGNEWCSPGVRQRAVREVVERGACVKDVAKLFGVSEAAVTKWVAKFRRGGVEALTTTKQTSKSVARVLTRGGRGWWR